MKKACGASTTGKKVAAISGQQHLEAESQYMTNEKLKKIYRGNFVTVKSLNIYPEIKKILSLYVSNIMASNLIKQNMMELQ